MLQKLGFTCKPVPSKVDGLALDNLEKQFANDLVNVEEDRKAGRYSAACYLVPVYQNPNGTILSEDKCSRIIKLARKYNVLLFCDDVYNLFYYDGQPRKRLFAYDNMKDSDYGGGSVISNCTFSKLLAPSLRLGWLELPTPIREMWKKSPILMSGGSMNTYTGGLVAELLHSGEAKQHIELTRNEQKEKMEATLEIFRESLPKSCKLINEPKGGYFMFIRLPSTVDSSRVVSYLREKHEILVLDGKRFLVGSSSESNGAENGIRISIAYPNLDDVKHAISTVCKSLEELC